MSDEIDALNRGLASFVLPAHRKTKAPDWDVIHGVMRVPGTDWCCATDGAHLVVQEGDRPGAPDAPDEVAKAARDLIGRRGGLVSEVCAARLCDLVESMTQASGGFPARVRVRIGPALPHAEGPQPSLDICGPGWAARLAPQKPRGGPPEWAPEVRT